METHSQIFENFSQFLKSNETQLIINRDLNSYERKALYEEIERLKNEYPNLTHITKLIKNRKVITIYKSLPKEFIDGEYNCLIQFIKDYSWPIMTLDREYILYSLKKTQPYMNTWTLYETIFLPLIFELGKGDLVNGLTIYRTVLSQIKKETIGFFVNNEDYQAFCLMGPFSEKKYKVSRKSIYNLSNSIPHSQPNNGRFYISIDIISANYNCCKLLNKKIVAESDSWEDFISKIIEKKEIRDGDKFGAYIRSNKYLRQLIFGQLNCHKIMDYSRSLIHAVCDQLLESQQIIESQLLCVMNDEIIIKTDESHRQLIEKIKLILSERIPSIYSILRIQSFNLLNLAGKEYFIKKIKYDHLLGEIDRSVIKCVDQKYLNQCIAYYEGTPVTSQDLRFEYEGHSARFDDSIFNKT